MQEDERVTTDIDIRRARSADARSLAELRWAFRQEEGEIPESADRMAFLQYTGPWLSDRLASGRWLAWVAEAGDVICGHICLQPIERMPDTRRVSNPIGYVTNFYVTAPRRSQGVGTALLRALTGHARAEGFNTLIVWPSERSTALYHRAGFRTPDELVELPLDHGLAPLTF
jgi:GNAT superfamily N-acetyltransferase